MYEHASWNASKNRLERDYDSNNYLDSSQLMNNSTEYKANKTHVIHIKLYKTTENDVSSLKIKE